MQNSKTDTALEAENVRLREALRFYYEGFEQRLETFRDGHTVIYIPSDKLKKDCGEIARHALGLPNPAGMAA